MSKFPSTIDLCGDTSDESDCGKKPTSRAGLNDMTRANATNDGATGPHNEPFAGAVGGLEEEEETRKPTVEEIQREQMDRQLASQLDSETRKQRAEERERERVDCELAALLDSAETSDEEKELLRPVFECPPVPKRSKKDRWRENSKKLDEILAESEFRMRGVVPPVIRAVVEGPPKPKRRPMIAKAGHVYNPSKKDEASLRKKVSEIVHSVHGCVYKFPPNATLRIKLEFRITRQKFNLRTTADIDNLVKLVLDALNQTIYRDDRQCVELVATKGITDAPVSKTVIEICETEITVWPDQDSEEE
jgi:Holliday junction resolvase RusA-like endonuclease